MSFYFNQSLTDEKISLLDVYLPAKYLKCHTKFFWRYHCISYVSLLDNTLIIRSMLFLKLFNPSCSLGSPPAISSKFIHEWVCLTKTD